MASREQHKMAKELRRDGYQVTIDGHGHWRVCDAAGRWLANFPASTANWRWVDNLRTKIRRREREYAKQDNKNGSAA